MKKILRPIIMTALVLAGLILLLSHFFSGGKFSTALMNADALYLPVLVNDLFHHQGNLSNWYLTPAPYLFPDFFVYSFIQLFTRHVETQVAVFAALQVLFSAGCVYFIYRGLLERHAGWAAALAVLVLVCLAMTVGSVATLSKDGNAYGFILLSAFHYGAFLGQLACFAILFFYADKVGKERAVGLVLLALVAFMAALSDGIFVIQFALPFAIVLIRTRLLWPDRPVFGAAMMVVAAASSLLGARSYAWLIEKQTKYPLVADLGMLNQQLDIAQHFFKDLFVQTPVLAVFLGVYYVVAFSAMFYWPEKYAKSASSSRLRFLLSFSFLSAFLTFAVTLLVTSLSSGPRYFIPFFYWPVLVAVVAICTLVRQKTTYCLFALPLLVICLQLDRDENRYQDRRQEVVDTHCIVNKIRELGLSNGIAAYWDAKPIQAFSRGAINIGQYTGALDEHRWITSERFYRSAYDFAVVTENQIDVYKISKAKLMRANGDPLASFQCGNKTLLTYAPGQLVPKKDPLRSVGDTYTWPGCEFQTRIGRPTPACEMEKQDVAAAGHLTYGPYDRLPAGRYAFALSYSSTDAKTSAVGEWDIVLALPDIAKVLQQGVMNGTEAAPGAVKGEFTVSPEDHMQKFEVRTLARPQLNLKIVDVRIDRLE